MSHGQGHEDGPFQERYAFRTKPGDAYSSARSWDGRGTPGGDSDGSDVAAEVADDSFSDVRGLGLRVTALLAGDPCLGALPLVTDGGVERFNESARQPFRQIAFSH
jgi:hypothetical protein